MNFTRYMGNEHIERLKETVLFKDFLRPDIDKGDVFVAVRAGRLDFYYCGGRLFSYNPSEGFSTHQKYASVLPCPQTTPYIAEKRLESLPKLTSFIQPIDDGTTVYDRIKDNCKHFAGQEAEAVSRLYRKYSACLQSNKDEVVVLDVEVTLKNEDLDESDRTNDRVDFLLLNTATRELRFFEAKSFANNEIRSNGEPQVVRQVKRYRKQLEPLENRNTLVAAYQEHVRVLNNLLGLDLPKPQELLPEPHLFIFNFDGDQKTGRLKNEKEKLQNEGVVVYALGDPKTTKMGALWNAK